MNFGWVLIIVLLLVGINGLLTRLLEGLWDSLRQRGSPIYVPLEWWMSAPFTLFVFAVLSALLTSFSGWRKWFRTFLLLCACKIIFAVVTGFFLYYRMGMSIPGAFSQAMFLSLPTVLVHLLLSSLAVMFLRDKEAFAGKVGQAVLSAPYLVETQLEEAALEPESLPAEPEAPPPERPVPTGTMAVPIGEILKSFPDGVLALSPREIAQLASFVDIPFDWILPQLPEGKVVVDALKVVSRVPDEAFRHSPREVARQFPDGKMELPLREIVSRVPGEFFGPPPQETQPEVDTEFPDLFQEIALAPVVSQPVEPVPVHEEPVEEAAQQPTPRLEEAAVPAGVPLVEALSLTEEEELLLERAKDIVRISTRSILSRFPEGTFRASVEHGSPEATSGEPTAVLPETVIVPLELIVPQLAEGEVNIPAKFILAQFPEGALSGSNEKIIRSLPQGRIGLPLRELVPELPPEILVPPQQELQPDVDEMPDPFRETKRVQLVEEAVPPEAAVEEETPAAVAAVPPAFEPVQPSPAPPPREQTPTVCYAEMLRESNPLVFPIEALFNLFPEGAIRLSREELERHLGGEMLKLPRSLVMGQLKEGRIMVPIEILSLQLPSEHLAMSREQIRARFAEGLVELPLREIVRQVLEEISQPPEDQKPQPECEEISTIFSEIPQQVRESESQEPVRAGVHAEIEKPKEEQPSLVSARAGAEIIPEQPAESPSTEQAVALGDETSAAKSWTILHSLLQRCSGLGIYDHLLFSAGDNYVVVLAPPSLNRQLAGCGIIEIMRQIQGFCEGYGLGPPFGIVVSASAGALACAELVRGEADRLILLASLNRSSAGFMSLLLQKFEPQLPDLSCLADAGGSTPQQTCPPYVVQSAGKIAVKSRRFSQEACGKIITALADVGIQNYFSGETDSGQRLLVVWGGASAFDGNPSGQASSYQETALPDGVFDIEAVSQYCVAAGLGSFESLLLLTPQTKITLDRSNSDPPAYLLCSFADAYAEGLVRAKARRALGFLE